MSAASVVSKKKASSLVVAASMSAVEALKDQAGLCRWDYAIRSVYHRAAKLSSSARRVFSPVSASSSPQTASAAACAGSRSRRAEEEKLHKAYHLVCWGPN